MAKLTEKVILEALASVQDPSQGRDIVALEMVSAIQIKDSNISFALQVPPHRGPAMEPVRRAAEQAALKIDGVTSATVMVTAHATTESLQASEEASPPLREKILESKVRRFVGLLQARAALVSQPQRLIWQLLCNSKVCVLVCLMLMFMGHHSLACLG